MMLAVQQIGTDYHRRTVCHAELKMGKYKFPISRGQQFHDVFDGNLIADGRLNGVA
jgi:hypothetical protein